ncbi:MULTISPECIES: integral membrane transport protein [Streptomyces]|uniref:integral membrane transport protein n=1 Tax=Streptomyces TaxID=1883 RepID=UPI001CD0B973|nr:integral membrane transport protein [Streptomyces sp. PSKA30]
MSAVTDAVPRPARPNPIGQSVRDSLVVAKRNLIRMSRIPDPVRSCWSGFISPSIRDRRPNALKEQVK